MYDESSSPSPPAVLVFIMKFEEPLIYYRTILIHDIYQKIYIVL